MLQHVLSKVINLPFFVFCFSILLWNLFFCFDLVFYIVGDSGIAGQDTIGSD